jgi:hypothetical protein
MPEGADVGSVHQCAGSHVSDRVGTLPEIGTSHPVPRSGGMAKLPEGGTGVDFPTRSKPVGLAGSIGVGGSGTALRLEILGERGLPTGAMVPRSSGMEATTWCLGRIWAKCGRGTGNGTPGPGATSCSLAVSGTSAQADKPRKSRPHVGKTEAPRARMLRLSTALDSRLTEFRIRACYHRLQCRQATEAARMSHPEPEFLLRRHEFVPVRFYKIVMTVSLLVNLLLAPSPGNTAPSRPR